MSRNILLILLTVVGMTSAWRYETRCTRSTAPNEAEETDVETSSSPSSRLNTDDYPLDSDRQLRLRCPNINDFLFIGLTQYGVSSVPSDESNTGSCEIRPNDCLVTVDYLANECNGLNSCDIQLDSQFLHLCKNHSSYLTIAYECIPGSQRVDVCSNDETFIIDSSQAKKASSLNKFSSFYLTSPSYPNEYRNNLNGCSCRLDYVKIESSGKKSSSVKPMGINLALTSFEFDLEEGSDRPCNKDTFSVDASTGNRTLCGQMKDFKELFIKSDNSVSFSFTSDDFISRRGFLLKLSTIDEAHCPLGSSRFAANKCIRVFAEERAAWSDAQKTCQSTGGRLFGVSDFAENLKLNSYMTDGDYWAVIRTNDRRLNVRTNGDRNKKKSCMTKSSLNYWEEQTSCSTKRPFICEYDVVKTETKPEDDEDGMSDTNGNRLIRVACGSASNLFAGAASSFKSADSVTTTTDVNSINSNSIKHTQPPASLVVDYDYEQQSSLTTSESLVQDAFSSLVRETTATSTVAAPAPTITSRFLSLFNHDYLLIFAIVCGLSIVLIAINVFCIWNYYNKKLNGYFKREQLAQTYRNSTLFGSKLATNTTSSGASSSNTTNRTFSSTVGSYVKVPAYEVCLANTTADHLDCELAAAAGLNRESTESALTRASFKLGTVNEFSTSRLILDHPHHHHHLQLQLQQPPHYYETLSAPNNHNHKHLLTSNYNGDYHVYNSMLSHAAPNSSTNKFDSIVVLPTSKLFASAANGPLTSSTVVLLKSSALTNDQQCELDYKLNQQQQQQQYSTLVYGDLSSSSTSSSSSPTTISSSSTSSNQPLITFVAGSSAI